MWERAEVPEARIRSSVEAHVQPPKRRHQIRTDSFGSLVPEWSVSRFVSSASAVYSSGVQEQSRSLRPFEQVDRKIEWPNCSTKWIHYDKSESTTASH